MNPTPEEWAYLAGFFDGEGSISRPRNAKILFRISQKDHESLRRVQGKFNVGWVRVKKARQGVTDPLEWGCVKRSDVTWLLNGMLPYLILKKERVTLALEDMKV